MAIRTGLEVVAYLYLVHGQLGNIDGVDLRLVAETVSLLGTHDHVSARSLFHAQEVFFETFDDLANAGQEFEWTPFWRLIQDLAGLVTQGVVEADDLLCRHSPTQSPLPLHGNP